MAGQLTMRDVASLSGINYNTLSDWVRRGFITPVMRVNRHTPIYSYQQCIGVAQAAALFETVRGCKLSYVAKVIRVFGQVDDQCLDVLLDHYVSGRALD